MSRILVVDDDPNIIELVSLYVRKDGHQVLSAQDGREALRIAEQETPDLMILDLMLPKLSGLEVCGKLRGQEHPLPIIMLTAKDTDVDKIVGLEIGADDYLTKPFNPRELMARVHSVLRRYNSAQSERDRLRYGDLTIDTAGHLAKLAGQSLELTAKEFALLAEFVRQPERALSREQLLDRVWGYDYYGKTRTVDVHVARLRGKLQASQTEIETVWGVGYKIVTK